MHKNIILHCRDDSAHFGITTLVRNWRSDDVFQIYTESKSNL